MGVAAGVASSASGSVGVNVAGLYGSVVLNADGTYTYTIYDNNASVQALRLTQRSLDRHLYLYDPRRLRLHIDDSADHYPRRSQRYARGSQRSERGSGGGRHFHATAGSTATGNVLAMIQMWMRAIQRA